MSFFSNSFLTIGSFLSLKVCILFPLRPCTFQTTIPNIAFSSPLFNFEFSISFSTSLLLDLFCFCLSFFLFILLILGEITFCQLFLWFCFPTLHSKFDILLIKLLSHTYFESLNTSFIELTLSVDSIKQVPFLLTFSSLPVEISVLE